MLWSEKGEKRRISWNSGDPFLIKFYKISLGIEFELKRHKKEPKIDATLQNLAGDRVELKKGIKRKQN